MEKVEVKFEKLVEVRLVQEHARLPAISVIVAEGTEILEEQKASTLRRPLELILQHYC